MFLAGSLLLAQPDLSPAAVETGARLYRTNCVGCHGVSAAPMTCSVNGRQYVAIAAGSSLFVYALGR